MNSRELSLIGWYEARCPYCWNWHTITEAENGYVFTWHERRMNHRFCKCVGVGMHITEDTQVRYEEQYRLVPVQLEPVEAPQRSLVKAVLERLR